MTAFDILLVAGLFIAALAVGAVCCVGLLVWFSGRPAANRSRPG